MLKNMMTENTGRHFLDSGSAYGRNWEKNQERDFGDEPCTTLEVWGVDDFYISVSTYHWLKNRLDYDEKIDKQFQAFAEGSDESWLTLMKEFFSQVIGENPMVVNTYNHDSVLDQTIQYATGGPGGSDIVLLQIHGGCDVRGGYTRPRAFQDWGNNLYYDKNFDLACTECDAAWHSDNAGYSFYAAAGVEKDWSDYESLHIDDLDEHNLVIHKGFVTHQSMLQDNLPCIDERVEKPGKIVFDPDNDTIYCPECGSVLQAYGRCEV